MHTQTSVRRSRHAGSRTNRRNNSVTRSRSSRSGSRRREGRGRTSAPRQTRAGGRKQPTFDPSQFINTNPIERTPEVYTATHTFADFGFSDQLVGTLARLSHKTPTPIQDKIIPSVLAGRDVVGIAETGTGKTAAFLLPLIERSLSGSKRQTLILTPTRELALQVDAELKKLADGLRIYSTICVGGVGIAPQMRGLRRENHFIIGTPGRVIDLMDRGNFDPSRVSAVVLDEADRMLDMGFINDMRKILGKTPTTRQTLFFSATMASDAEKLVNDFLNDPVTVSVKKKDIAATIEQDVVRHGANDKFETLISLLGDRTLSRVIIFGSMKHSVEKLAKQLSARGIKAESIHGNKSHGQRQRSLSAFKSGNARVLVATDVAARGIHVDSISHVINYDLPNTFEDYVHRIGRTGRSTKRGKALTFVPSTR